MLHRRQMPVRVLMEVREATVRSVHFLQDSAEVAVLEMLPAVLAAEAVVVKLLQEQQPLFQPALLVEDQTAVRPTTTLRKAEEAEVPRQQEQLAPEVRHHSVEEEEAHRLLPRRTTRLAAEDLSEVAAEEAEAEA